jgi:hypothetical protein
VNHREKSGSLTPFFDEAMVYPYRTLSKWFPKTLPGTSKSFGEPSRQEWFPHTIPRRGNSFLIPYNLQMVPENSFGLLRVSVNHREQRGSLTPFFNEVMVSPYRTLSKWFPKTLPGTSNSFGEPPSVERFPHTIPQRSNGFLIPYTLEMVPENSFLACRGFL